MTPAPSYNPDDVLLGTCCPPDRETWAHLLALHLDEGGTEDAAMRWSADGPNYDPHAARDTIRSLSRRPPSGRKGALLVLARQHGYHDAIPRPEARRAPVSPPAPARKATPAGPDPDAVWAACAPAQPDHGYLLARDMPPDSLRVAPPGFAVGTTPAAGWLAIPSWTLDGTLHSIQFVADLPDQAGGHAKRNLPGRPVAGGVWIAHPAAPDGRPMPDAFAGGVCYLAEGAATAATIYRATGHPAACCYGTSNVDVVARALRERYPELRIVLALDRGTEHQMAEIAAGLAGAVAWVQMPDDAPKNHDANDYAAAHGLDALADLLRHERLPPDREPWPAGDGSIAAMLDTPAPEQQWHFGRQMPAGRAVLLSALGGSSKTRALLHMAIGTAVGHLPWGWEVCRTGHAALFLTEDTADDVHRALRAIVDHGGYTEDERRLIATRLHIWPLAGHNARLLGLVGVGVLEPTIQAHRLLETLQGIPDLAFVGLDPALGLTEGDEMSPAHQRRLGEYVDGLAIRTGATVVLTSHAAKSVQTADELGTHTSRGSGAITDAVRAEYVLRTMTAAEAARYGITDIEERKSHVQLTATKGNALPPSAFVPMWLRRGPGGVLVPADLELQTPDARTSASLTAPQQKALAILRRLAARATPNLADWRTACEQAGIVTGPTPDARRKHMTRLRDRLHALGLIEPGMGRDVWTPTGSASDA